jgi:PAS domain S-box-containing protein
LYFQRLSAEELVTRLAAIVDSSEDAIIGRDEHGVIQTWNAAAAKLFGYTAEEIVGQSVLLIVPPELHHEERRNLERLRHGERINHYETQRIRRGGQRIGVSITVSPIKDDNGTIIGSSLIARDLSSAQRDVAAQSRLAAIVESSDDAIVAKDLNGVVTSWNAGAERLFGYSAEQMIGRSIMTIIPPDLQHEEPMILARIASGERVDHYETQRVDSSGKRFEVSLTLSPIRDAAGHVIGVSKIARDISERRRLDTARLMLAAIVESSDDAIISKNLDGIITSWNASAERLFGYKPHEIIGQSVLRLIPRELQHEEPIILSKLRRGERIDHFETRRVKKNGETIDISLTVSPIRDDKGRVIGASKIVRDISERKAAEAALLEKEKLAATGRLAATLAHEVNNPLESIMNLSFLLANDQALPEHLRAYADMLVKEVQRAGEITRQTLSFYRTTKVTGEVDVADVIQHVLVSKQKKTVDKRINITKCFDSEISVKGYAGELRQVFDNIIENAIDAVPAGGHIHARGRTFGAPGAQRLCVSICDDGPGIAPDIMHRIFEPFFTTKLNSGSGVGLWVTHGIVMKHGGTIRVRSSRRIGTVFTVTLPLGQNGENGETKTQTRKSLLAA